MTDPDRFDHYRAMPGMSAYHQIAEDYRAGVITEDQARSYCDVLFPIVTSAEGTVPPVPPVPLAPPVPPAPEEL